ncbi:hypothetical protein PAXRUDRAFT_835502 [Paxillus rubicundulus Ve08.2h10]|uniref:Uncharacterized protein n=1 Tax=Paxillus rubicundulus Ve08.2h10 TaxID=930991 RepID=A0A0D0DEL6_9AGAM|nr:hypothetical protein PAXRUDRAFT_835502 [Paxillus rubicundulus Ve08.2h10]
MLRCDVGVVCASVAPSSTGPRLKRSSMGIQASTLLINIKHTSYPSARSSGTRHPISLSGIPFSARRKTPSSSRIARQYISEHARRTGNTGDVPHALGTCSDVMPLDITHWSSNSLPPKTLSQPAHVTTSILAA